MGYDTDFNGSFTVEPPLNAAEVDYLKKFASTRHCKHQPGPFVADGTWSCPGTGTCSQETPGMPGLWCKWESNGDGTAISWNGVEKFYDAELWIAWLIRHLLGPDAAGRLPAELDAFTSDHTLNGTVNAQGEDPDDRWQIIITGNRVIRRDAKAAEYGDEVPV